MEGEKLHNYAQIVLKKMSTALEKKYPAINSIPFETILLWCTAIFMANGIQIIFAFAGLSRSGFFSHSTISAFSWQVSIQVCFFHLSFFLFDACMYTVQ